MDALGICRGMAVAGNEPEEMGVGPIYAIFIGHRYGVSGAPMVEQALIEGKPRGAKYVVTTMRIDGSIGAAGLFEVAENPVGLLF